MNTDESMREAYIDETQQLLQSLTDTLLAGERHKRLSGDQINEIFRVMHTIKGSSSMMAFDEMTKLAHILEDMFSQVRDNGASDAHWPVIFDLTFDAVSFFNGELAKLQEKRPPDGDATALEGRVLAHLERLKGDAREGKDAPYYKVKLFFEDGCQMEGLRAFGVVQSLKGICRNIATVPEDTDADSASEMIRSNGLCLYVQTNENPDKLKSLIETTLFMKSYSLLPIEADGGELPEAMCRAPVAADKGAPDGGRPEESGPETIARQNFISVNVNKLDKLLNIVGEIVTAQSMVFSHANFGRTPHDGFDAAARQLNARVNELQDVVMNIRMVPVSTLFQKMRRLVRDMSRKFNKEIDLVLAGEDTEVDKNVIDHLSDPLLHIIRNSIDHGIEDAETRQAQGKPARGRITIAARTTGGDVIVSVSDDGRGLQRDAILKKALEKGMLTEIDGEIPDQDVFAMIFQPGFSTKEQVTEYSGRGVGMDVVRKNIGSIGGSISVESLQGKGTAYRIRIPLTLTIVDGMKFTIGEMGFIVPTVSVRAVVKPEPGDVFKDSFGNEMIMLKGKCCRLVRLNQYFHIDGGVTELSRGMILHIASEREEYCVFFDRLEGEYQVVMKNLPGYLKKCALPLTGIGGCAVMGDGSIYLILDVNGIS